MGSPAQFAHLTNFAAALRKPGLIQFGTFNSADSAWLAVITDMPGIVPTGSVATRATIPYAATIIINCQAAIVQEIFLTGNITSLTIDGGPVNGQLLELRFIQQASPGGWSVDLSGILHDSSFSVDPTLGVETVLPLIYRSASNEWQFFGMGFSDPGP